MLKDILPNEIANQIAYLVTNKDLNEIRIRAGKPIVVLLSGQAYYLSETSITTDQASAIIASKTMIEDIVFRASECSIYSVNEQIKRGYIMCGGGVRIGLCGTLVTENGETKTIKNFTSLNIRIPHFIHGVSLKVFDEIVNKNGIKNTLIISPPGVGKTTFLRDFVYQLSQKNLPANVLIIDERGEMVSAGSDKDEFNLGKFYDVMSYSEKPNAIMSGIRVMNPHLVVCDEIGGAEDIDALKKASLSGVSIMASVHASGIDDLRKKPDYKSMLDSKTFSRYIVLSNREGNGTIECLYNENFERLKFF